jgi:hypothetical protein
MVLVSGKITLIFEAGKISSQNADSLGLLYEKSA